MNDDRLTQLNELAGELQRQAGSIHGLRLWRDGTSLTRWMGIWRGTFVAVECHTEASLIITSEEWRRCEAYLEMIWSLGGIALLVTEANVRHFRSPALRTEHSLSLAELRAGSSPPSGRDWARWDRLIHRKPAPEGPLDAS